MFHRYQSAARPCRASGRADLRISLVKRCAARTTARDVRTAPRAGSMMRCGSMGEFVAAGRRGTAGSGASPTLVFSCTGGIACGALADSQISALGRAPRQGTDQIRRSADDCGRIPRSTTERHGPHAKVILSLAVSCRWRQGQRGGRGSRAAVREPARPGEPGPAVAGRSGQPTGAHGASTGRRALTLVEPQQVEAGGYRTQSLSSSSGCLISGRAVTCSCWSRSAVLT